MLEQPSLLVLPLRVSFPVCFLYNGSYCSIADAAQCVCHWQHPASQLLTQGQVCSWCADRALHINMVIVKFWLLHIQLPLAQL